MSPRHRVEIKTSVEKQAESGVGMYSGNVFQLLATPSLPGSCQASYVPPRAPRSVVSSLHSYDTAKRDRYAVRTRVAMSERGTVAAGQTSYRSLERPESPAASGA